MAEPNIKATVYNTDVTYNATPIDTGIKILAIIDTPCGTYDIRNNTGKSDFINHYLDVGEIQVQHDVSVKQVGYLLDYTNIYTKRIGTMNLKQGVSSLGELLLFDNGNELIEKFYRLEIDKWEDTLPYYYIANGKTMYYSGDITNMDQAEKDKFDKKIQVNAVKSIDNLVQNLYKFVGDDMIILKTVDNSILCREKLTFSPNISVSSIDNVNKYNRVSNAEFMTMDMGDYLKIRDTIYYYQGDGSFSPTRYSNPVAIYSPNVTQNYDAGLFWLKVLKILQDEATSYQVMPEIRGDGGLVMTYKGVKGEWELDGDCETKLKLVDNGKGLGIYDADDEINGGVVRLTFFRAPQLPSAPVLSTIPTTYNNNTGNAIMQSNNSLSPTANTKIRITLEGVENTWNFQDDMNVASTKEGTTAKLYFNIPLYSASYSYELTVGQVVSDEQVRKFWSVEYMGNVIQQIPIDFTVNKTLRDVTVKLPKIEGVGEVIIKLEKATITTPVVNRVTNTKTRQITVKQGNNEVYHHEVDFTGGNTVKNIQFEDIELTGSGNLSVELDKATFTNPKMESVYQEVLTEDQLNGIDLKIQFIIGQPNSSTPEGYTEINLSSDSLTALGVMDALFNTFDVLESSDYDITPTDFSLSTVGQFTAYFEKREEIAKAKSAGDDIKSFTIEKDGDIITYQYDFTADAFMASSMKNTDFYIKINEKLFFVGKNSPAGVNSQGGGTPISREPITYADFIDKLADKLYNNFSDVAIYQNGFAFVSNFELDFKGITARKEMEKQQTSAQFAAIQKFPVNDKLFAMGYERNDTEALDGTIYEVYDVTLTYKGNSETYDISFDEAAIDGFSRSLYYDRVQNDYIILKKLDGKGMLDSLSTYYWGSEIKPKTSSLTDYITAVDSILEKENIWFDFIWDAGKAHPSLTNAINKICQQKFAMNIVSLPPEYNYDQNDKTGYNKLVEYARNLAMDSRYSRIVWAKIRSGNVGNFSTVINGSTLSLRNYITNYNASGAEFCPQMGINYGKLEGTHLILPEKSKRDYLIDNFKIATVKGGDGVYPYHINDNGTTQSIKTSYSEEQNVRTSNAIIHGIDKIFYTYLGLKNDFMTRESLVSKCTQYVNERCVNNQTFSISQLLLVCDSTNNSDEDVANNILNLDVYVRYGRAVKFGRIKMFSLPLDTGSTTAA